MTRCEMHNRFVDLFEHTASHLWDIAAAERGVPGVDPLPPAEIQAMASLLWEMAGTVEGYRQVCEREGRYRCRSGRTGWRGWPKR